MDDPRSTPFTSWFDFWRRFRRNRAAVLGLFIILMFGFFALGAPWLAPAGPFVISERSFVPPGPGAWFGSGDLGRDVLVGVLYGARVSLLVGLLAALTAALIGVLLGAVSGYIGGLVDAVLMRITEMFQIMPKLFLAIIVVALLGGGIGKLIIVIGILSWPQTARVVRGQFLALRQQEFAEAARALGFGRRYIIFREILPNALPAVIVLASLDVAQAILLEASLGFFGLGDRHLVSWGQMLNDAQRFLRQAWWMSTFPGLAIFFTVIGFNLFGDGVNDALNPRLQKP